MGYVDYQNSCITSVHSVSESNRFGYSTDRISVGALALSAYGSLTALTGSLRDAIEESVSRIVILRYPSELVSLIRDIPAANSQVYPGGAIIYWEGPRKLSPTNDVKAVAIEIAPAERKTHITEIVGVLEDSFKGYVNHYSCNPLLSSDVVVEGYVEWAVSTMADPLNRVFVVKMSGVVIGAAIVAVSNSVWEIELASIAKTAQGRGNYLSLIQQILVSAHAEAASSVVISTQSHNIAAQRAWAKMGFRPLSAVETVHLVRG